MTDFYASNEWTSVEREFDGTHYDLIMSGSVSAWKAVNPTVKHYLYTLLQTTILPGPTPSTGTPATQWYDDAVRWYALHPEFNIETAFLHQTGKIPDSSHRLTPFGWSTYTWVINPRDPGITAYHLDRFKRLIALEDGLFIDSQGSGDLEKNFKDPTGISLEYADSGGWPPTGKYYTDYAALMSTLKKSVSGKTLQPNTAGYIFEPDFSLITAAGATHMEKSNNPLSSSLVANWAWIDRLLAAGASANFVSDLDYADMVGVAKSFGGSTTPELAYERVKMAELASYYMVVPANPDPLQLQLVNMWDHPLSSIWIKALEANIGHPLAARHQVAGTVASDPLGQSVQVFEREFDRALVLFRPQNGWSTQHYDDATAISVGLPPTESWLPLHADGTLGTAVTNVPLRNAESAILIKARTIR